MYYKKLVYKYGNVCNEKTGKSSVFPDFMYDIQNCKPDNIRETKTALYIHFPGKYSELYILPVSCKKYIINEYNEKQN